MYLSRIQLGSKLYPDLIWVYVNLFRILIISHHLSHVHIGLDQIGSDQLKFEPDGLLVLGMGRVCSGSSQNPIFLVSGLVVRNRHFGSGQFAGCKL